MTGQDVKCSKCDDTGKVPCPHPSAGGVTAVYGWNPCECEAGEKAAADTCFSRPRDAARRRSAVEVLREEVAALKDTVSSLEDRVRWLEGVSE
jgi:hypothetical protein